MAWESDAGPQNGFQQRLDFTISLPSKHNYTASPTRTPGRVYTMRLAEDVQKFAGACERLLATAAISNRTLTEDEARIIQYYCKEVAEKLFPPSLPSHCDS
jgi:hypothetical protein